MEKIQLGGLEVSQMGLGCMGMSEFYGPVDWERSIATIHRALELGVTMVDTADIYGAGHNEVLVGRAIRERRDEVQLATKFGIDRSRGDAIRTYRGERRYALRSCDASLLRLDVEAIDLYYLHRPPDDVEIEEPIEAMAELVKAGKIRHLGVSGVNQEQLRRAHAVHPIAAIQSPYSLWNREIEHLAPTLADLGVGLVPYATLGRGNMASPVGDLLSADADSGRRIAEMLRATAERMGATPAQVALAWVYAQAGRLDIPIVAIPGTTRPERVAENLAALSLTIDEEAQSDLSV